MRANPEELLSDLMSISRWSWRVPAHVPLDKPPIFEIRKFSAMTNDLRKLSEWTAGYSVTAVAMESTGIYWKQIFGYCHGWRYKRKLYIDHSEQRQRYHWSALRRPQR